MEKLIKLLDIYRRENKTEELFGEPGTLVPLTGKDFIMLNRVIIISKEYGFIKWLVDNDKVDRDKLEKKVLKEDLIRKFDEGLIMLLSISDHQIEDLCSILK